MNRLVRWGIGVTPWLVIAGLLYVGLFVKPKPIGSTVIPTAIEARDRFYGMASVDSISLGSWSGRKNCPQ